MGLEQTVYYSNQAESSYRLKTSLERAAEAGLEAGWDPPGHMSTAAEPLTTASTYGFTTTILLSGSE